MMLLLSFISAAHAVTFSEKDGGVIRVKIQKPEIQILISKRNLTPRYDLELKESFLPQIVESVEKKPF